MKTKNPLNRAGGALLLASILLLTTALAQTAKKAPTRTVPGRTATGTLLPNGWTLTPEGEQITVSQLPLNMVLSPDGRYLLSTTNGYGLQQIDVIDVSAGKSTQTLTVRKSWLGLAFAPDGRRFFVSGGDDNEVLLFDFAAGHATEAGRISLGSPEYHALDDRGREAARRAGRGEFLFPAGIAVSPDGKRLFVAENLSNKLSVVDLASLKALTNIQVGEYPYDCLVSRDGRTVYVSNWGSRTVSVIDAGRLEAVGEIRVGDHPNDLELTRDGRKLYVANANSNTVSVVDTVARKEVEAISTALHPKSPIGSAPNAVALSPDERTLYVANADNNDVAVVEVNAQGPSRIKGFIPTGWYPTSVRVSRDGHKLFVANGKGLASAANPQGPNPTRVRDEGTQYIGSLLRGTISIITVPGKSRLLQLTRRTYRNSPYTDSLLSAAKPPLRPSPIPARKGQISPIKHVIYVIKENRTYDQVMGDMKEGNGDVSLCLFGEDVTPNQHAIARQFVLLDNFYDNAEVSADGHNWSMGAYATDYVVKTWPTNFSSRGRTFDYEGSKKISRPTHGYIWDSCQRAHLTYRSYGEFISVKDTKPGGGGDNEDWPADSRPELINFSFEPALQGHFSPPFPAWNLSITDNKRIDIWLEEFQAYEKSGKLPQFQIVRIGGDHTQGTRAGAPTPRAHVADNDLALGRLVEAVSHSSYWTSTAIFVVEDDAQNGPDHVDAHRSIAFVVSPYTKRGAVDSTMYTTAGMLRTMELILGLPPMSQYDAAATPMYNAFQFKPDLAPFGALPARVPLDEKNATAAPGSQRSAEFDFSREDAAPDIEFNEIIWKAVRGSASTMPGPVRSAFVRSVADGDGDGDDDDRHEPAVRKATKTKRR